VPLTLDVDALGLFLETVEPGIVPAPGTSLGVGLAKGLDAFVDKERRNKAMVLVSDGEDLEGHVEAAAARAREAGVVVYAVGVGSEAGQPVPETDADGRVTGYKRDADGRPVVSRLEMQNLEAIARETGGQAFRITPQDTSLSRLAAAIEGMEQKTLAKEYSYRRKEQFQVPLAFGLVCLSAALALPPPRLSRRRRVTGSPGAGVAAALVLLLAAGTARAQSLPPSPPASANPAASAAHAPAAVKAGSVWDEVLLRPRRETAKGRQEYQRGNHPEALAAFERAAAARPGDQALRFNVADGLYKKGSYDEASTLFRSLGSDPAAPLAAPARFNLGNSLYQKQDYRGAIQAYRDALRLAPKDEATRKNLELALRALREQQEQQKHEQQKNQQGQNKEQQQGQQQQGQQQQQQNQQNQRQQQGRQQKPQTQQERDDQRFRQEAGMPRERAMQLLDALQQNEMAEQKKLLALKRARARKGKDW
jgi:Ca-activated chloride channel family protein